MGPLDPTLTDQLGKMETEHDGLDVLRWLSGIPYTDVTWPNACGSELIGAQ